MRRASRSPIDETLLAGKIVIENLPRRSITTSDIHTWLKKYGTISEIAIYKDCALVQFDSDLEAAGAVQCEDGGQFFGSVVSVKHAEPGILSSIRRSGPPIDRFTTGTRRYPASSNVRDRDRDRDRGRERDADRERERLRDRDRDRGRPRDRDSSPRSRFHEDSYDRRRRRDDLSPRRQSRSPVGQRGDRRHVHPLNWLSEVAGTDKNAAVNGSSDTKTGSGRIPAPYTVAIVAVQHDLVSYAEMIEKRVSACLKVPDYVDRSAVRTHIVVLLSADHLTPCLADLTKDGVPFAIICTTNNWAHGSCTLRILYVPTQQEHRNMPLDDAMVLLQKEYDAKLALERPAAAPPVSTATAPVSSSTPTPIVPSDDHTFLAPSRDMSNLLRMLADSRILSIGELDEIAAFIQERKRRLEGRRQDNASVDPRSGNAMDLKSRILNMIYPQTPGSAVPVDSYTGMGNYQAASNAMPLQPAAPVDQTNRLGAGLANPVVQQAIDTLMRVPTDRFPQQSVPQLTTQPGANIDVMNRINPQKGVMGVPPPRPFGQPMRGSFLSYRGPEDDRTKVNQAADGKTGPGLRFSSYKPAPGNDVSKSVQQGSTQQKKDTGFRPPTGGARGYPQIGNNMDDGNTQEVPMNISQSSSREDEAPSQGWRSRKRGKRGGGRGGQSDQQQSSQQQQQQQQPQQQQKATQPSSQRQPVDLMSTDVTPVGTLAETYRQNQDPYQYPRKPPLLPGSGSLFGPPSAPFYMTHPTGYPYPGQPYY